MCRACRASTRSAMASLVPATVQNFGALLCVCFASVRSLFFCTILKKKLSRVSHLSTRGARTRQQTRARVALFGLQTKKGRGLGCLRARQQVGQVGDGVRPHRHAVYGAPKRVRVNWHARRGGCACARGCPHCIPRNTLVDLLADQVRDRVGVGVVVVKVPVGLVLARPARDGQASARNTSIAQRLDVDTAATCRSRLDHTARLKSAPDAHADAR